MNVFVKAGRKTNSLKHLHVVLLINNCKTTTMQLVKTSLYLQAKIGTMT